MLPPVEIRPANDLDVGGELVVRASGAIGTGKTITAWLSEASEHSTNTPAAEVAGAAGTLTKVLTEPDPGAYDGAIDRDDVDDHIIDASPAFYPMGTRRLYLHWDDGADFHEVAPCMVRPR